MPASTENGNSNGSVSHAEDKHLDVLRAIERARVEVKKRKPLDLVSLASLEVYEMMNNNWRDVCLEFDAIKKKVARHDKEITKLKTLNIGQLVVSILVMLATIFGIIMIFKK